MKNSFEYLFSTNEDGVDVYLGVNAKGEDIVFKIRESGCKEHEKAQRKYQKSLSLTRKNPEKEHLILSKIVAEAIIVDWSGILDEKGKKIDCTYENKLDALVKYKKLFYEIIKEATNEDNFRDFDPGYNEAKDTEKNSKKS